jgi:hypothetical protein
VLSGAFALCFLCFSSLNFLTYRYLLPAIVPILFFVAVYTDSFASQSYKWLYWPALGIFLGINFWNFRVSTNFGDAEVGAFKGMEVQQGLVTYLEQHNAYDKHISTGSFLNLEHLIDPATGFLSSNKVFTKVGWANDSSTQLAVFNNIECDNRHEAMTKDTLTFRRVYRIERGPIWGEIYERR